jgi:hypothetical protein
VCLEISEIAEAKLSSRRVCTYLSRQTDRRRSIQGSRTGSPAYQTSVGSSMRRLSEKLRADMQHNILKICFFSGIESLDATLWSILLGVAATLHAHQLPCGSTIRASSRRSVALALRSLTMISIPPGPSTAVMKSAPLTLARSGPCKPISPFLSAHL